MNTSNTLEICSSLDKALQQFGNINFLNKENLYFLIDYIRNCFQINLYDVFNIVDFCKNNFKDIITYDFHEFNDKKIGGLLVKNNFPEQSYITVNSSKEPKSVVFDLTHEMIHYLLHPENRKHYISSSLCDVDNFEWQANEGAAELIVPYKRFIPYFAKNIKQIKTREDYLEFLDHLSDIYRISTAVLEYRIASLKYEIYQYENGISIDKLQLLSKTAQEEQGINITPYSTIFKSKNTDLKSILSKFSIIKTDNLGSIKTHTPTYIEDNLRWQNILDNLKKTGKIRLYAVLGNTTSTYNNNSITIQFKKITEFEERILKTKDCLDTLKETIKNEYGEDINIKIYNLQEQQYVYDEFIEDILPPKKDVFLT